MSRILTLSVGLMVAASGAAFAQSSGSFNYAADTTACTDISGQLGGGTAVTALKTTMKVSSGSGNALVIRPSAVVGLLTDTTISTGKNTASSQASVSFAVTVTPLSGQAPPAVIPSAPVTFDDRFIQISTNLFDLIGASCAITGTNPLGCTFSLNETTLSAHSFDWVVTGLTSGNYGITVTWTPTTTAAAPSSAMACVGPVVLTTEQAKIFNQSSGISF